MNAGDPVRSCPTARPPRGRATEGFGCSGPTRRRSAPALLLLLRGVPHAHPCGTGAHVNNIFYIIGVVVVVLFILGFLGFR